MVIKILTKDTWSADNANDKCGLSITQDSNPNGAVYDLPQDSEDWSEYANLSTIYVEDADSADPSVAISSITLQNNGSARLSDVDITLSDASGDIQYTREIDNELNTATFTFDNEYVLSAMSVLADITPLPLGESLNIVISAVVSESAFDNTFPVEASNYARLIKANYGGPIINDPIEEEVV